MGGARMMGMLAAWSMVQVDRETDQGYEKTGTVNGRPTHEQFSKNNSTSEYDVVIGERFLVSAHGSGLAMDVVKSSMASIDLAKLESMKDQGLKK